MNTMEIDGIKYELILHGQGCTDVPSVMCDGKAYIGKAIVNKPNKDYEILSFRSIFQELFFLKFRSDGRYAADEDATIAPYIAKENEMLNNKNFTIYSVKRLSDGEIFTIGDKCSYKEKGTDSIKEFKVEFNTILVYFTSFATYFKYTEKVKKPIFKTEDGVDIYEGDCCFAVAHESNWYMHKWENVKADTYTYIFKYFSTEEAAENWRLMNKPCLSVNDVVNLCDDIRDEIKQIDVDDLISLAKEKINATT